MKVRLLISTLLCIVLGFAHSFAAAQADAPVATVNGTAIPQSRLARAIALLNQRGVKDTPEVRRDMLEELIVREVVQQEALRRELDKLPEFAVALEEARNNLLIQAFTREHLRRNPVPDSAVKAEYDRQVAAAAAQKPDTKVLSFEEAAPRLRSALEQQSVREAAAELRKQARIE